MATKQALPLIPIRERIEVLYNSMEKMEEDIKGVLFNEKLKPDTAKKKALSRVEDQRSFNFAWIALNVNSAVIESTDKIRKRLISLGLKAKRPNDTKALKRRAMNRLAEKSNAALDSVEKKIREFFRLLKKARGALLQNLSSKEVIDKGIKSILSTESLSRGMVQKEIKQLFQKVFGDFNFIEVTTKTGKIINYQPAPYFKMVARTEMRKVQTESTLNSCNQYGCDLVQVSTHDDPCPICAEYEGRIYSISGNDKQYEPLPGDLMPIHPNCEHGLNPVTRAYLRMIA